MKKEQKKAGKKPAKDKKNKKEIIENEMFNFDNEIVIGITKLPDKNKKKEKNKKSEKEKKKKTKKNKQKRETKKPNKKIDLKKEKQKRRIMSFLKGISIITIIIGSLIALMLSPLFKITQIEVLGNAKTTPNEIIILSEIEEGDNLFLTNNNYIINKIKEQAYIETVDIKKKLPNKIIIEIKERKATYSMKYGEKYIYINNQGYILEIANNTNNLPEITSYKTPIEEIKIGGRLSSNDLELLRNSIKNNRISYKQWYRKSNNQYRHSK